MKLTIKKLNEIHLVLLASNRSDLANAIKLMRKNIPPRYNCKCGKPCYMSDRYMLTDDIWLKINGSKKGFICWDHMVKLFKSKFGRELTKNDFIDAPINHHNINVIKLKGKFSPRRSEQYENSKNTIL